MKLEIFLPRLIAFWLAKILREHMKVVSHLSYDIVLYNTLDEWIQVQKESKMPAAPLRVRFWSKAKDLHRDQETA